MNFASPHVQLRFLDAIFIRQFSRRYRHRRLLKLRTTSHDYARLRTAKHNGRLYSFINKISFHGSGLFIFTGPTGCCSASTEVSEAQVARESSRCCDADALDSSS